MRALKTRYLFLFSLGLLAITGITAVTVRARRLPARLVHNDVLRLNDGTVHMGELKSFDGTTFVFETDSGPVQATRAMVAAIVLGGTAVAPSTPSTPAGPGTVKDIDGNVYKTVRIGHQVWFAENLRTTRYNDGTAIQNVRDFKSWGTTKTGAYAWYMNNIDNKPTYGALYNWHAANTKKLCPKGWHVPEHQEWLALANFLVRDVGKKLKMTGTTFWKNNKDDVTNETGFSALPGGIRFANGEFRNAETSANFWSASEGRPTEGRTFVIMDNSNHMNYVSPKETGMSVRCVRD